MKKIALFMSVCLILLSLCSCNTDDDKKQTATEIMMDTVVTLTVWDGSDEILDGALDICRKYNALFSKTVESSDVSRINRAAGNVTSVDPETAELIKFSQFVSRSCDGAFDITVLPLTELWNISSATAPPDSESIDKAKKAVGYGRVTVNGTDITTPEDIGIDLGGIAKGYIADRVRDYFEANGISRAIINLGGNVTVLGSNGKKQFAVGIQKPFDLHGESAAIAYLSDKTAVTSGIYERYFEFEGNIYHHIIDPKTGCPVQNGIASVTVITESSVIADCLSTACLILGISDGTRLAKSYGAETVFIDTDGKITVSDGLLLDTNGAIPKITEKQ